MMQGRALPRSRLEQEVLPALLPAQRWFADKGRPIALVRLADAAAIERDELQAYYATIEVELATNRFETSGASAVRTYFFPMWSDEPDDRGERSFGDALANDAFAFALLDDVRRAARRRGERGLFVAEPTKPLGSLELSAQPRVRRPNVEQSNSSVVIDEQVMLKAYRLLQTGPQPELEIARFLDAAGFRHTPALLGWIEYVDAAGESTALCILQRFVKNQGDGWSAVLAFLERSFVQRGTRTAVAEGSAGARSDDLARFLERMQTLGARTAELHRALATPSGDPAFEPEAVTQSDLEAWYERARSTARSGLDSLERLLEAAPLEQQTAARGLLGRRHEALARLETPSLGSLELCKTRYHGDFHLGQVLLVGDDFAIVDFEGEPARPLSVRRDKSSPLRDVAGMVRSIDYAALAALRAPSAAGRDDAASLRAMARDWQQQASRAFLDGYRATIGSCISYPSDALWGRRLLDLFVLEKAFYELSYELAHRPAWLGIPIEGITSVLDGERSTDDVSAG